MSRAISVANVSGSDKYDRMYTAGKQTLKLDKYSELNVAKYKKNYSV